MPHRRPIDVDVKLDLHGSSLTLGLTDFRTTRAVIRGVARNLLNDRNALKVAVEDAIETAGETYHSVENLPLATVRAVRFGPDKALIRLGYQYRPLFSAPFGSVPAFTTVQVRGIEARTPVYRGTVKNNQTAFLDGLPEGPLLGIDPTRLNDPEAPRPHSWMFARAAMKIIVTTHLLENPLAAVSLALKQLNADSVDFADQTFAPLTILFNALNVDWDIGPRSGRGQRDVRRAWSVVYEFIAVAGGHFIQRLYAPREELPDGTTTLAWTTRNEQAAPAISGFRNSFPVHA